MKKVTISEQLRASIIAMAESEEGKKVVNVAIDAFNGLTAVHGVETQVKDLNCFAMYGIRHYIRTFLRYNGEYEVYSFSMTHFGTSLWYDDGYCSISFGNDYSISIYNNGTVALQYNCKDIVTL